MENRRWNSLRICYQKIFEKYIFKVMQEKLYNYSLNIKNLFKLDLNSEIYSKFSELIKFK